MVISCMILCRCNQVFQLCEFGHCQYHPERPQFRQVLEMQAPDNPVGLYPCCNQRVLRFDPTGLSKGSHVEFLIHCEYAIVYYPKLGNNYIDNVQDAQISRSAAIRFLSFRVMSDSIYIILCKYLKLVLPCQGKPCN